MLTVKKFKNWLIKKNSLDWLHIAIGSENNKQFYIVGNGGMGSTISMPIERFSSEIKACVFDMLQIGELVINEQQNVLLDRDAMVHYLFLSSVNKEDL